MFFLFFSLTFENHFWWSLSVKLIESLPSKINEIFFHLNLFNMSIVACAKYLYSADISTALSHWSNWLLSPWRRTRGMPVTAESAHADAFEWLPPMSAMTFCWRNVKTAENNNEKQTAFWQPLVNAHEVLLLNYHQEPSSSPLPLYNMFLFFLTR